MIFFHEDLSPSGNTVVWEITEMIVVKMQIRHSIGVLYPKAFLATLLAV
jgi:hypothetical protein